MFACALVFSLLERLYAAASRGSVPYDALSYHLALPLSWLHTGRIGTIPLPFGDGAPAFAPASPEVLGVTWISLTGTLQGAQMSQWPFLLLGVLAVGETARRRGAPAATAWALAGLMLCLPELYEQSTCAMADVACTGAAMAAVGLVMTVGVWSVDAWLALGLLAGTKSVGLVLASAFGGVVLLSKLLRTLALAPGRRVRPVIASRLLLVRALLLIAAFLLGGGFWCLRTMLRTGNPVFPVAVVVGGHVLFSGFYTSADMRGWDYHIPLMQLGKLFEIAREQGSGFWLVVLAWPLLSLRRRWLTWAALLGGAAFAWVVLPYQQPRFFLPVWASAVLIVGWLSEHHGANRDVPRGSLVLYVGLAIAWLGPMLPSRWLAVAVALLGGAIAAAAGHGRGRRFARQTGLGRRFAFLKVAIVRHGPAGLVTFMLVAPLLASLMVSSPPLTLADAGGEATDTLAPAWRWLDQHGGHAPVFVTGINLVGPLAGPRAARAIHYVDLAGDRDKSLDQYPRPHELGRVPLSPEPAPDRLREDRTSWLQTLQATAPAWLVVARLEPIVARAIDHDEQGFPRERAWADGPHPSTPSVFFRLSFANASMRIYAIEGARHPNEKRQGAPQ